jgi:hypothetical protein
VGSWDRLYADLSRLLRQGGKLNADLANLVVNDSDYVRAIGGGETTGLSPVDRRKKASKYILLVDRHAVPVVVRTPETNISDHRQIIPVVLDFRAVGGRPGRPKGLLDRLYTKHESNSQRGRALITWPGIEPTLPSSGPRMRAGGCGGWWSGPPDG